MEKIKQMIVKIFTVYKDDCKDILRKELLEMKWAGVGSLRAS